MNITEFLEARIAEDEKNASRYLGVLPDGDLAPLFRRVLAECAAKRAVLAIHHDVGESQGETESGYGILAHACSACGTFGEYGEEFPCGTVKSLAAVYADHADYQREWAL